MFSGFTYRKEELIYDPFRAASVALQITKKCFENVPCQALSLDVPFLDFNKDLSQSKSYLHLHAQLSDIQGYDECIETFEADSIEEVCFLTYLVFHNAKVPEMP